MAQKSKSFEKENTSGKTSSSRASAVAVMLILFFSSTEPFALVVTEQGTLCALPTEKLIGNRQALGSVCQVRRGNKTDKVTTAAYG